ncbi:MAG: ribonuclease [Kiritimatiellae bacterium]|nr:ribonuclease [Kiritimatiellia bacterium]
MKHGKLSLVAALVAGFAATFGGSALADAPLASGVASTNSVAPAANYTIVVTNVAATATNAVNRAQIVRDGEYTSKDDVAAYIRQFRGALPRNFITKGAARALGWQGGPLEPYAPGKSIGGDRFGNYERKLPWLNGGYYKECDIDTKGRPRGAKRLIFTQKGQKIYYTDDHYRTFKEVK